MTTAIASIEALPLSCSACGAAYAPAPIAICEECLGPLEPAYDPGRALPDRATLAARPPSMWRYREWLPYRGEITRSVEVGFTPLVEAPALARELHVARLWVKNDAVSYPSLSFKDRVVASAINAAHALGLETLACASTGNLANAVAAHAAQCELPAWIFVPADLEPAKLINTAVYGARLVRVRGTYDDVNRLCAQVADRFPWAVVNVNLRSYYGEGSKTQGFEIAEQLGWKLPSAVVAPMAGGSLLCKLYRGFGEFRSAGLVGNGLPKMFGAQAAGCAPIVRLVERGGTRIEPVVPNTIARSIAIGNPADGAQAARVIHDSGGWAAAVSDQDIAEGIRLLARTTGIFTETAGGATVAAARVLADSGRITEDDDVVLCITGNGLKTIDVVADALEATTVVDAKLSAVHDIVDRG